MKSKMHMRRITAALLASSALAGLASTAGFAQTDGEAFESLEEVLVTAQRRTESLQDTAISASVLSGDLLEQKGVNELFDIQYAAPDSVTTRFYYRPIASHAIALLNPAT